MELKNLEASDLKTVCVIPNLGTYGAYDVTGKDEIMLHEYEIDNIKNEKLRDEDRRKVKVKQFIHEGILITDKTVTNAKVTSHEITECKIEKGERLVFLNDEEGFILPDIKFGTFKEIHAEVENIEKIYNEMSDNNEFSNT